MTKCSGVNCPIKDKCHRFTFVIPDNEYYWLTQYEYDKETKSCNHFISNTKTK